MPSLAFSEGDLGLGRHVVSKQQGGLEGRGQAVALTGLPKCNQRPGADPRGTSGESSMAKNIRVVKWRMFTSLISNLHNCSVKNSASVRQLRGQWKPSQTQGGGGGRASILLVGQGQWLRRLLRSSAWESDQMRARTLDGLISQTTIEAKECTLRKLSFWAVIMT